MKNLITTRKLLRDASEAVRVVNRPWYRTPEVSIPRQYARMEPWIIKQAMKLGVAELVKRSGLPTETVMEILAP